MLPLNTHTHHTHTGRDAGSGTKQDKGRRIIFEITETELS